LFKESVGRWDFIGGDMLSLKKSIVSLIDKNEDNIIIYPGHGPSSTIREERMNNKYYFSWKHNN
jgi:glyoxylase-like metal-dependent hydrolase (beta-lactamase superfamily II)